MKVRLRGRVVDIKTVWMEGDTILMIDQRFLPEELRIFHAHDVEDVAKAIERMIIRGAPAIGAAAAFGMALAWHGTSDMEGAYHRLSKTRPTGHDLFHALNLMMDAWRDGKDLARASRAYSKNLSSVCRSIGRNGSRLIRRGDHILTHCNAGALATVDYGTALAPIRAAHSLGRRIFVYVSETRPRLQGSLLTAWELEQEGIDHAVIVDGASGYLLSQGKVNLVMVGADRIAANGDTANKVGTYEKAVLAKENGVPFYVAAPTSTFDISIRSGDQISIEHRDEDEVLEVRGVRLAPKGTKAYNPAFDVTPARYVTGYITEGGVLEAKDIVKLEGRKGRKRAS